MGVTASNFLAGPGALWYAPFGTTEPVDSNISSTFAASGWTDIGGTQDGVTMSWESEFFELECDQIVDIPESRQVKRALKVKTNMAETTLLNLKTALNGGTITASASYQTFDPDDIGASQSATYWALCFVGKAPGGFNRRIFCRKSLSTESVEMAYKKGEQTLIPVTFTIHYVTSVIKPFRIIDGTV